MQERSASGPTAEDVDAPPTYPADLTIALQAELAVLADIETDLCGQATRSGDVGGSAEDEGADHSTA